MLRENRMSTSRIIICIREISTIPVVRLASPFQLNWCTGVSLSTAMYLSILPDVAILTRNCLSISPSIRLSASPPRHPIPNLNLNLHRTLLSPSQTQFELWNVCVRMFSALQSGLWSRSGSGLGLVSSWPNISRSNRRVGVCRGG